MELPPFVSFFGEDTILDPSVIDENTQYVYGRGHCFLLALALHERTGLPLIIWDTDDTTEVSWRGHVAVQYPDGTILDIWGRYRPEDVPARFPECVVSEPRLMPRDELVKQVVYWDFYVADPWAPVGDEAKTATYQVADLLLAR